MPSAVPEPLHAPAAQPTHSAQCPLVHWVSAVHQQATPAASQAPAAGVTVSQLPTEHAHTVAAETSVWQSAPSVAPLPEHVPVHCPLLLAHLPLEQSESATQRHAV